MSDLQTDLIGATIQNRLDALARQINLDMYGDKVPPPTRWQWFRYRWRSRWWRVRDAWLVLTGKAEIG